MIDNKGSRLMSAIPQFVKKWKQEVERSACSVEEKLYVKRSWVRYAFVLQRVFECAARCENRTTPAELSILDVGPHFFTCLIRKQFPHAEINTLGYENFHICPESVRQAHLTFDLNETQFPERWPAFKKHDIVVMGEVIEHLHTAPWLVLGFIKTLVKEGGYLIVTTPNAVSISKRIKFLFGKHPFEMLREEIMNPGHIREYTAKELKEIGSKAGLVVDQIFLASYFVYDNPMVDRLNRLVSGCVPSLRNGITVIYRRP
jgi:hypothetical protein